MIFPRIIVLAGLILVSGLALAQVSFCQESVVEPRRSAKTPLELLREPDVRWDLELLDGQSKAIDGLVIRIRKEILNRYQQATTLAPKNHVAMHREIQNYIPRLYANAGNELQDVLLPHQIRRLKQIHLQLGLRTVAEHAQMSDEIADILDLTETQKKRLLEKAAEIKSEMQAKIDQIRREGEQKLLAEVLTPTQLEKLKRQIGRRFKRRE